MIGADAPGCVAAATEWPAAAACAIGVAVRPRAPIGCDGRAGLRPGRDAGLATGRGALGRGRRHGSSRSTARPIRVGPRRGRRPVDRPPRSGFEPGVGTAYVVDRRRRRRWSWSRTRTRSLPHSEERRGDAPGVVPRGRTRVGHGLGVAVLGARQLPRAAGSGSPIEGAHGLLARVPLGDAGWPWWSRHRPPPGAPKADGATTSGSRTSNGGWMAAADLLPASSGDRWMTVRTPIVHRGEAVASCASSDAASRRASPGSSCGARQRDGTRACARLPGERYLAGSRGPPLVWNVPDRGNRTPILASNVARPRDDRVRRGHGRSARCGRSRSARGRGANVPRHGDWPELDAADRGPRGGDRGDRGRLRDDRRGRGGRRGDPGGRTPTPVSTSSTRRSPHRRSGPVSSGRCCTCRSTPTRRRQWPTFRDRLPGIRLEQLDRDAVRGAYAD